MTTRTLLRHNRIWTGKPHISGDGSASDPWTDALLVENGRVVAVGEDAKEAGGIDTVVDLPGAVAMPGLHDAHMHSEWVSRDLREVDLRECRSLEATLEQIAAHAANRPPGEPLMSGRWNHNQWDVPVEPDRHALDRVLPDRPALLDAVHGHVLWVNSRALQLAGITRDTPDPVGGQIDRDEHGEPTGILREEAMALAYAIPFEEPPLRPMLPQTQQQLLAYGLTAITDIDGQSCRDAWLSLHADGALALRVTTCAREPELDRALAEGRTAGAGDDWVRVGPVKFFSDGALGSRTAHMTEPYLGHESCGMAVTPYPVLVQRILHAASGGLDVCTHAIGDEANRLVLDAYREVRAAGHAGTILRIEHAQHVRPIDVPRFRSLDVWASMQPTHALTDLDLVEQVVGPRRLASYAWQSMLDAGVSLAFGSDAPVETPNPFHALQAAVTRCRLDGYPPGGWQPHERISFDDAVHAHTVGAHRAARRDDAGALLPGQVADLICLDTDPWQLAEDNPRAIADVTVLQTWTGGQLRYG